MTIRWERHFSFTPHFALTLIAAMSFVGLPVGAQSAGVCFDSTTLRAKVYRDAYQNMVSRTDGAGAQ